MRSIIYVDGFNLYYGCLRETTCPHKWLDLAKLFSVLLPGDEVAGIKYFTARVVPRADKPGIAQRQQIYLRTIPTLSIHYGHFLKTKVHGEFTKPTDWP